MTKPAQLLSGLAGSSEWEARMNESLRLGDNFASAIGTRLIVACRAPGAELLATLAAVEFFCPLVVAMVASVLAQG
jgi:hypothetical protein